ncbi:MAG: hypothetical protein ACP5XB_17225 [Isosphaeraceae bacterium]
MTTDDVAAEDTVMTALHEEYRLPGGSSVAIDIGSEKTLLTDGPWDEIDLGSLLPLRETVFLNTDVGTASGTIGYRRQTSITTTRPASRQLRDRQVGSNSRSNAAWRVAGPTWLSVGSRLMGWLSSASPSYPW